MRCCGGEGEKNECAAVGEKGRRMLCGRLGQRFQKGGAVRAACRERESAFYWGAVEGFWGCSVLRAVRGAGVFGGAMR